jgi:hypothetical protein
LTIGTTVPSPVVNRHAGQDTRLDLPTTAQPTLPHIVIGGLGQDQETIVDRIIDSQCTLSDIFPILREFGLRDESKEFLRYEKLWRQYRGNPFPALESTSF